jgi:hypothetical protein
MSALLCPSCGAEVPVRSAAMPYVVCAHCQTVVMREAEGLRKIGKSATLPFDVSPLQLGTRGVARGGRSFEVVGRVRWGWSHGSWNEWLARCDDGSHLWLGEAMGSFMQLAEDKGLLADSLARAFAAGQPIALGAKLDRIFTVSDIKEATCIAGEGDLPFPTSPDWTMTSIDFRSTDGRAANLQRDANGVTAWSGYYLGLSALQPWNLRTIDGWSLPECLQ